MKNVITECPNYGLCGTVTATGKCSKLCFERAGLVCHDESTPISHEQFAVLNSRTKAHSKLMGLLQRAPYIGCADTYRQYAVNWLMNNGVTVPVPAESKPPELETVLGYAKYNCGYMPHWIEVCWTGEKWVDRGGLRLTVTYWMPLPRLPEIGG